MKKSSSKNIERKAQREAKAVQQHKTALRLSALAERGAVPPQLEMERAFCR